jgi:hypothetical protein
MAQQVHADRLGEAKALFFDHKYAQARQIWQQVLDTNKGAEADTAAFWIARCSELLGENERAFGEYKAFLARRPADATLVEEARTGQVTVAAKLYKDGKTAYRTTLVDALGDKTRTVRYYAALQLAGLGPEAGRPAIPVLLEIVEQEKDPDLVDRAKLRLLSLDPDRLARAPEARTPRPAAQWLKIRIYDKGHSEPKVVVNVPVALAEMVFKNLPDEARHELKRKGYDADNFWEKLRRLGPTQVIDIQGDDGERVQIWLE